MYWAVIFDLDGVICSTDHYHYCAWKEISGELGVEFNEKINNRLRGIGRLESLEIILETYPGELAEETKKYYAEKKNSLYRQLITKMSPADLSAEVKTTLDRIKAKELKMAIGSSSKNTKLILRQLGLNDYFDAVSDGTNISRSKPDPEVFIKASEYLGIEPGHCLVVEDAKAGVEAAQSANMDCAAIGEAAKHELATYKLKTISDLLFYV